MDRAGAGEDFARGQCSDSAQFGQPAARFGDGNLDVVGGLGDPPIQTAHLGDEVDSQTAEGFTGEVTGPEPCAAGRQPAWR